MGPFAQAMRYYPYVVHPITVLGGGMLVLVHHEWARQGGDVSALWHRVGGFLAAGALGVLPTVTYFLLRGTNVVRATQGNGWRMDALVAGGILIAAGATWGLWRYFRWGELVPDAMRVLAAVTVPYAVVSPFWNVSGHVIVALAPTLYLTLVDRRFWPLLVPPVVMVPNRVYLDAHTWAQSIAGFVLAAVIVVGLARPGVARERR